MKANKNFKKMRPSTIIVAVLGFATLGFCIYLVQFQAQFQTLHAFTNPQYIIAGVCAALVTLVLLKLWVKFYYEYAEPARIAKSYQVIKNQYTALSRLTKGILLTVLTIAVVGFGLAAVGVFGHLVDPHFLGLVFNNSISMFTIAAVAAVAFLSGAWLFSYCYKLNLLTTAELRIMKFNTFIKSASLEKSFEKSQQVVNEFYKDILFFESMGSLCHDPADYIRNVLENKNNLKNHFLEVFYGESDSIEDIFDRYLKEAPVPNVLDIKTLKGKLCDLDPDGGRYSGDSYGYTLSLKAAPTQADRESPGDVTISGALAHQAGVGGAAYYNGDSGHGLVSI